MSLTLRSDGLQLTLRASSDCRLLPCPCAPGRASCCACCHCGSCSAACALLRCFFCCRSGASSAGTELRCCRTWPACP